MGDFTIDLVPKVMLQWRVRCVQRGAPIEATSGPDALALVTALVATLERGFPPPGLGRSARAWAARAGDGAGAHGALACLAEVVTEVAASLVDDRTAGELDAFFEQLARATAAGAAAGREPAVVGAGGYPDRRLLECHLDQLAADALVTGGDVAMGVIELERKRGAAAHLPRRALVRADEDAVGDLSARLHRLAGEGRVYRTGARKLAVVVPGTDTAGLGELVLRTTATGAPRFLWGAASLGAAGIEAVGSADSLIVLAEADLHLRRRDLLCARRQLANHRRRFVLATVTSVVVLVAGILGAVNGVGGRSVPPRSASPVRPAATAPPVTPPPTGAEPNLRIPPPGRGGGAPVQLTVATPAGGTPTGGTPNGGPGSTTPPAGVSPPAPATAVLDQLLSTVVGAVSGVARLLGVQVVSAVPHTQAAGPFRLRLGG